MLANFHTHTTFCDGKNTPEEMVLAALEKEFSAIGFSVHGRTDFDLRYCTKDCDGYIKEILRLKEKYKNDISIYLGAEEDSLAFVNREEFDYIIGSAHYLLLGNSYYPVDSGYESVQKCLAQFDNDVLAFAEAYYSAFCRYIHFRKPDIIGHFDLITKFDELNDSLFFSNNEYNKLAEKYIEFAAESQCVFEVNTGAIAKGYRTTPYPRENLLHKLRKLDAKIILSSDCHKAEDLDFKFEETKKYLKDIGFSKLMTIKDDKFAEYSI